MFQVVKSAAVEPSLHLVKAQFEQILPPDTKPPPARPIAPSVSSTPKQAPPPPIQRMRLPRVRTL